MKHLLAILIVTVFCVSVTQAQTIVYVKSTAAGSNNGSSWANAYTSLRTALANAPTGAQVWVAQGTYYPPAGATRTQSNTITDKALTIYGGFPATGSPTMAQRIPIIYPTIVSGDVNNDDDTWTPSTNYNDTTRDDNTYNVFTINATGTTSRTITIDGLVIQDGNANGANAGSSRYGGAIYAGKTSNGGSTLTLNIKNCVFRRNTAVYCGAIGTYYLYVNNGNFNLSVTNNKFYDNAADGWTVYGHVYAATNAGTNSVVMFMNNVVYRNYANLSSAPTGLIAYTCTGNTTGSSVEYDAHFNTFADNVIAGSNGGVICAEGPGNTNGNSSLYISNNIFWNNSNQASVFKRSATNTAFVQPSGIDHNMAAAPDSFVVTGKNNKFGNPKFENPAIYYRLSPCSEAINSGSLDVYTTPNSYVTVQPGSKDVEDNTRQQGGTIDRGAYEYFGSQSGPSAVSISASVCPGSTYSFDSQNLGTPGIYRDTLTNMNGCDSVVTLTLSLKNTSNDTFNVSVCAGDSFSFNNVNYGVAGYYTGNFINVSGCDSIKTLHLSVNPKPAPVITQAGYLLSVTGGPFDTYQWYFNGNIISGATQATYTATANGNYTVDVSKVNGSLTCTAMSASYAVTSIGMQQPDGRIVFSVYPNPAQQMVTVQVSEPTEITLCNTLGQVIEKKFVSDKVELNVQHLPKGVYFVGSVAKTGFTRLVLQ